MALVNVLLDIPTMSPSVFVYCWGNSFGEPVQGMRVVVEAGRKKMEGWVLDLVNEAPKDVRPKPVIEVLDDTSLLRPSVLTLAKWISQTYICPMNIVLKAMLPPRPARGRAALIIPGNVPKEELGKCTPEVCELIKQLEIGQSMTWEQALRMVARKELIQLKNKKWIMTLGAMKPKAVGSHGWVYKLGQYNQEKHLELRRSPR